MDRKHSKLFTVLVAAQQQMMNECARNKASDNIVSVEDNMFETRPFKYFPRDIYELRTIIGKKLKENIKEPNLLDIDTSLVNDFSELFRPTPMLTHCGVRLWDTKKLDLSTWNTSNVESMARMFLGCSGLIEIIGLENFDMSKVTSVSGMFCGCKKLEHINIEQWDLKNKIDSDDGFCGTCMFWDCNKAVIPKWYNDI